jgi:glutaconate CoA-transferase subunit A
VTCPFTGEVLTATRALTPDVAIIHAQKADRKGNVLIEGIIGIQKEAVLASKRAIVTVEEIVDDLDAHMNACVLPGWVVNYVCEVPGGAFPSYAHGYYKRDNAFCKAWDGISREREPFVAWMQEHVLDTEDFAAFRQSLMRASEESHA